MAARMRALLGDAALRATARLSQTSWATRIIGGGAVGGAVGKLQCMSDMEWTPKGDDPCASCAGRPRLVCIAVCCVAAEGAAIGAAQTVTAPIWVPWAALEYARFKLSDAPRAADVSDAQAM